MKKIKLGSKKYPGLWALVDDQDYDRVNSLKWYPNKRGNITYAYRATRKCPHHHMHRFILKIKKSKLQVDHIDGNGLNNVRSNLRLATREQNSWNSGKQKNNTTGYRGVSKHSSGLYRARTSTMRTTVLLGYFKTPLEASLAYEKFVKKKQGVFYRSPK